MFKYAYNHVAHHVERQSWRCIGVCCILTYCPISWDNRVARHVVPANSSVHLYTKNGFR